MAMIANYPAPIYLCNTATTGIQTAILDASDAITANLPAILQIVISASATVKIEAAIELDSTGAMVDPFDISSGGYSASDMRDLVLTVPFYRVNVTANTGTVKVKVGQAALAPGARGKLHLVTLTNVGTSGM